jgi:hypothetical protein
MQTLLNYASRVIKWRERNKKSEIVLLKLSAVKKPRKSSWSSSVGWEWNKDKELSHFVHAEWKFFIKVSRLSESKRHTLQRIARKISFVLGISHRKILYSWLLNLGFSKEKHLLFLEQILE